MGLKTIILCAATTGLASCAKPYCIEHKDAYGKYLGYECEIKQSGELPTISYGHISSPDKATCYARSTSSHFQETYIDYGCDNMTDKFYNIISTSSAGEPRITAASREQLDESFNDTLDHNYMTIKNKLPNKIDKKNR